MGQSLVLARILRLTGIALVVGFLLSLGLASLLALDLSPTPQSEQLFVISIIVGIGRIFLGIPLVVIGNKISPPDPWLDSWLSPIRFRKSLNTVQGTDPSERAGIWATVTSERVLGGKLAIEGRCLLEFERGYIFLEESGKDHVVLLEPKRLLKTSSLTLLVDSGRWNYGKVTLTLDSASDADRVEQEVKKLLAPRTELSK